VICFLSIAIGKSVLGMHHYARRLSSLFLPKFGQVLKHVVHQVILWLIGLVKSDVRSVSETLVHMVVMLSEGSVRYLRK